METVGDLADRIIERSRFAERFLVAIAGPPGAGKSTLSQALAKKIPDSAVLQGDGYHYDNMLLDELGLRQRKGAHNTFDCRGLELTLGRIRAGEDNVVVPVFDREMDVARGGAQTIRRDARHVLVEGNYLVVDRHPWSTLRPYFDFTVMIDVPRDELDRRLMKRWADLGWPEATARAWVDSNDLPNIDFVQAASGPCDIVWRP